MCRSVHKIKFHCEHKNRTSVNKVIMELKITLHSSTKFRNVVLWGVPIKVPKRLLECLHSVLKNGQVNNSPQKNPHAHAALPKKYFESTHEIEEYCPLISCSEGFKASARRFSLCAWNLAKIKNPKNSSHTALPEEILCIHQQNWRVLFFDKFQWTIHCVCTNIFTPWLETCQNKQTKKIVHIHYCPRKYSATSHESEECCSLICSNERSMASAQRFSLLVWKLAKNKNPQK